jgi:hypothetical protein
MGVKPIGKNQLGSDVPMNVKWRHHARRHLAFIGTSDPAKPIQDLTPRSL